jgi:glycosyltransferase involved in cell wall biosynthesis
MERFMEKLKVVWLCPLNLNLFRDRIKIRGSNLVNKHPATWITTLIEEFRQRPGVDLTVIAASAKITRDYQFTEAGVHYHILARGIPFTGKGYPGYCNLEQYTHYWFLRRKVRRIVNRIQPSIINLHGTEHELSAVVNHLGFPVVIEIQGFINSVIKYRNTRYNRNRLRIENAVFRKQKDFIIHTRYMRNFILNQNPSARFHYAHYPISNYAFDLPEQEKSCDISFHASIIREKGIEDLVEAARIARDQKPDLSVKVMGMVLSREYLDYIRDKIAGYGMEKNFHIMGFIPDHKQLLTEVKKCRMTVFPTHFDTSPGTVGESQSVGLPVISNNLDGIPDMIENGKNGLLVERGNIPQLAKTILELLSDAERQAQMGKAAKQYALDNYHVKAVTDKMLRIYHEVIDSQQY